MLMCTLTQVPKAPELKPDEEKALKDMAEKARLMVEEMKNDPEKVRLARACVAVEGTVNFRPKS
jgi:hypothetical protein